jgi:hypothetical protein
MTIATTDRPLQPAEMGRKEAEEVTQAIKNNFDSLGAMLAQARDRKAYKALGYRSFETYCQTEFGKSISSAYQLIEDAKILSQLEARISQNYGEAITLNIPASHLRPLKTVEGIDDKLKVIEFAQKLAAGEGKKPTKQHLEIAVFEISGKRSEDFKSAIQKLGFTKGVQVETVSPLKKERGLVTNVDKTGLIYVELYYGNNKAIPYRATELRILTNEEKPTNPLEGSIASKGDRVLIFAEGLQGKQGTVYTWKEGKTTLVMVDGQNSPTVVAYAEMELIKKTEAKNADWESELVWESGKNTYYYFPREDKIYSNRWPAGLFLNPYTHSGSPPEFMENWEKRFSHRVLESLATPDKLKTLLIAQAIELPVNKGREFAADLIDCLQQFLPQDITKTTALQQENEQLREQLAEAEAAIQSIVDRVKSSIPGEDATQSDFSLKNTANNSDPRDTAAQSDFSGENTSEASSPGDTAKVADWKSILTSNNFTPNYHYTDDCTEDHRGWKIYLDPNGGYRYVDLNHPQKGAFCSDINHLNIELEDENEIISWAKGVVNQVEDFCPGQLSFNFHTPTSTPEIEKDLPLEILEQLQYERDKANDRLEQNRAKKYDFHGNNGHKTNKKEIQQLEKKIDDDYAKLEQLEKFSLFRVGQTVCHKRDPIKLGKISKLEFSQGGMPLVWVKYFKEGEPEKTPTSELVSMIFIVDI